jgi:hypothetical protein
MDGSSSFPENAGDGLLVFCRVGQKTEIKRICEICILLSSRYAVQAGTLTEIQSVGRGKKCMTQIVQKGGHGQKQTDSRHTDRRCRERTKTDLAGFLPQELKSAHFMS